MEAPIYPGMVCWCRRLSEKEFRGYRMTYKCDTCKEVKDDCEITLFHGHYLRMCKECRYTPNLRVKHESQQKSGGRIRFVCPECNHYWFRIDKKEVRRSRTNLMNEFPHTYRLTYPESWVHDNDNPVIIYRATCNKCGVTWEFPGEVTVLRRQSVEVRSADK